MKVEVIDKLFKKSSSGKEMLHAFSVFSPTRKNWYVLLIILVLSCIPAIVISISETTVALFLNSVDMILNTLLALFGIIFTGYAIFQAILNEKMLIKMIEQTHGTNKDEKSLLQETNESFVGLMLLTILGIFISFFAKLILGSINTEFSIFSSDILNEVCSSVACTMFFFYVAVIIWEMKSFVFNIFQLFNAYSGARIIEIIEKKSRN